MALRPLAEQITQWPIPVFAGVLFYVLWVPIVLIAAWMTWFRSRMRWMPVISADREEWKRATWFMLALGLPIALLFGALFALKSVVVLVAVVVVTCIGLVGFMLPRLNRWW